MNTKQMELITKLTELFLEDSVIEKEITIYKSREVLERIDPYEGKKERHDKIQRIIESSEEGLDAYALQWLFNELEFKSLEKIKALTLLVQTTDPDEIMEQIPSLAGMPNYLVENAKDALMNKIKMAGKKGGIKSAEAFNSVIKSKVRQEYLHLLTGKRIVNNEKSKAIKYGERGARSAFATTMQKEKNCSYNSVIKWWDKWEKEK